MPPTHSNKFEGKDTQQRAETFIDNVSNTVLEASAIGRLIGGTKEHFSKV